VTHEETFNYGYKRLSETPRHWCKSVHETLWHQCKNLRYFGTTHTHNNVWFKF